MLSMGVASETSNLVSEASMPSAGAGWQRPAIGRPTSASFLNLSIKVPPKCENYLKLVGTYGNFISKCSIISENMAPILAHMVLLNRSYSKVLL